MNADLGAGTPEQIETIVKDYWSAQEPILASMEPAPDPIKADVETLRALARQGASTGDSATFTSPDLQTADRNIDQYMLRECGYGQISITATDNAYQGIPATISSGAVGITLNNEGREAHQVLIVRINDGVTEPFSALLDLPPDQRMQTATALGSVEVDPGGAGTLFLRLVPGRYGVADFLSQGTDRPRHVRRRRSELRSRPQRRVHRHLILHPCSPIDADHQPSTTTSGRGRPPPPYRAPPTRPRPTPAGARRPRRGRDRRSRRAAPTGTRPAAVEWGHRPVHPDRHRPACCTSIPIILGPSRVTFVRRLDHGQRRRALAGRTSDPSSAPGASR